jgi:hypothetical protein
MRAPVALAAASLVAIAMTSPVLGQMHGVPKDILLSAGWSWPSEGPLENGWSPGFTIAGSFRGPTGPNVQSGAEIGYTWFGLDEAAFRDQYPGISVTGGDAGMLTIASETDLLLGASEKPLRPFINAGLGFYYSFVDDTVVTAGPARDVVNLYDTGYFGIHGGVGLMIHRGKIGFRIDATYHHLFTGGDDIGFVPVRGAIVFSKPR